MPLDSTEPTNPDRYTANVESEIEEFNQHMDLKPTSKA